MLSHIIDTAKSLTPSSQKSESALTHQSGAQMDKINEDNWGLRIWGPCPFIAVLGGIGLSFWAAPAPANVKNVSRIQKLEN